jgi:hypothetical protein
MLATGTVGYWNCTLGYSGIGECCYFLLALIFILAIICHY